MHANLFELLRIHWSVAPNRQFLVPTDAEPLTYEQVDERAGRFATCLREEGVTAGERVLLQINKSADNVALYLACLRVGAIVMPLNTAYTEREVAFFVDDASPRVIIDESNIAEWSARASAAEPWMNCEPRLADDVAALLYTSGTTGRAKGAMITHGNLASNALTLHSSWQFVPGDVLLHFLPIYHVHGLFVALHTAMLNASTVLFCDRFDLPTVIDLIPEASVMMGVPTHYTRLIDDPRFDTDLCANMRLFTSGSAPMTEGLHRDFEDRSGHRILERYGMTETGMMTSNPYDGERKAGTVGFPLPGVQLRVVGDEQTPCGPGDVGVVQAQGPNVFAGYWRLPEKTAEAYDGDWFITGDVGFADDEGRITLEGRATDMIISGGLNVYPREVELVLDEFDGVHESAVVGIADDDLGERVHAFIVSEPDVDVDLAELTTFARSQLAGFKVPKAMELIDSLPRNTMGKIQKAKLRTRTE